MVKKILSGAYNWTMLSVVIIGVVLINIIASYVYKRFDMTADQRYSLAPTTVKYLEDKNNFSNRLSIKIYLAGNLPAELEHFKQTIEDKLKEFKEHAGKRIEYEFVNPNPEDGSEEDNRALQERIYADGKGVLPMRVRFKKDNQDSEMTIWPGAELIYNGSTKLSVQFLPGTKSRPYELKELDRQINNSINNLEYILVSSIRRATQRKKPNIAFLQGHGELEPRQMLRVQAVLKPYYDLQMLEVGDSIEALDNVDGLVIARPMEKIPEQELFIIDQFVMRGGSLICFVDQLSFLQDTLYKNGATHTERINSGVDKMLFNYGLKINDQYVKDASCIPMPNLFQNYKSVPFLPWFYNIVTTSTDHPITRNLEPIKLEYASNLDFDVNTTGVSFTPILTSSTNSRLSGIAPVIEFAEPFKYDLQDPQLVPNAKDESNKRCLAGMMEGKFKSYFRNRINKEYIERVKKEAPSKTVLEESSKPGRIFVVGNGRFLANNYDTLLRENGRGYFAVPKEPNELMFDRNMNYLFPDRPTPFGNQEFVQNIMDYMLGETSILELRSRQIDIHYIDKDKVKKSATYYKMLNVGLPIILILALAFGMHFIRKRKYA